MTDQTDKTRSQPVEDVAEHAGSAAPAAISRRAVLRGATVAVPTILTLNSGTALAIASARVTASTTPGRDGDNFLCLDTTGQLGPEYDVSKGARVTAVPVFYEYVEKSQLVGVNLNAIDQAISSGQVTPLRADQLCRNQATTYVALKVSYAGPNKKYDVYYRDGVMVEGRMPQSAALSVSAYNSVEAKEGSLTSFLV